MIPSNIFQCVLTFYMYMYVYTHMWVCACTFKLIDTQKNIWLGLGITSQTQDAPRHTNLGQGLGLLVTEGSRFRV